MGEWSVSCGDPAGDRRALASLESLDETNVRERLCEKLKTYANSQRAILQSMGDSLRNEFSL
jgi:hypothetical protein